MHYLNDMHISVIGVEKLNDDTKKKYFRKTNQQDPAADMLKNDYRADYLKEYEREKQKHT